MSNTTNRSSSTVYDRKAQSVSVQTSAFALWGLLAVVAAIVSITAIASKWRMATAEETLPLGLFPFDHKFDFVASVGDFILGASWIDFGKNMFMIALITFLGYLVYPVLPFRQRKW